MRLADSAGAPGGVKCHTRHAPRPHSIGGRRGCGANGQSAQRVVADRSRREAELRAVWVAGGGMQEGVQGWLRLLPAGVAAGVGLAARL
jgi:hypothetical protein